MRGYNDFDRLDSLGVHFVYADEVDFDFLVGMPVYALSHGVHVAYIDGAEVVSGNLDLCNSVGNAVNTDNRPYGVSAWWPLCDDLVALSYRAGGLLVVVDNSRELLASREREVLKFVEIFQIQSRHWVDQGKICDLYFQMDFVNGLRSAVLGSHHLKTNGKN